MVTPSPSPLSPSNKPSSQPDASPLNNQLPMVLSNEKLEAASHEKDPSGKLSTSPWAKMFPSGATEEQLKMFIQCYIKDLMAEIKRSDDKHKANLAEQRRQMEENS